MIYIGANMSFAVFLMILCYNFVIQLNTIVLYSVNSHFPVHTPETTKIVITFLFRGEGKKVLEKIHVCVCVRTFFYGSLCFCFVTARSSMKSLVFLRCYISFVLSRKVCAHEKSFSMFHVRELWDLQCRLNIKTDGRGECPAK